MTGMTESPDNSQTPEPSRHSIRVMSELVFPLILTVAIVLIFLPLFTHLVRGTATQVPYTDYPAHNIFAARMRQEHRISMPHPIYHFVVIGTQQLLELTGRAPSPEQFPEPDATTAADMAATSNEMQGPALAALNFRYSTASIYTLLLFYIFTGLILQSALRQSLGKPEFTSELINLVLTLCLLIAGPIALLHSHDQQYYFGYISSSLWHNPTVLAAKIFAIPVFIGVAGIFENAHRTKRKLEQAMKIAAITMLAMLAKPSLVMAMIPAAIVAAAWYFYFRKSFRWNLFAAFLLPAIFLLLIQAKMYESVNQHSHLQFKPFATVREMSPGTWGFKLLLSIVFPVACYWLTFRRGVVCNRLNFAWVTFGFGLCLMYFVAESRRTSHGNLIWSAQLAMYVLFVESVRATIEWWRQNQASNPSQPSFFKMRIAVLVLLFAAHVGYGIAYYLHLQSVPITTPLLYM